MKPLDANKYHEEQRSLSAHIALQKILKIEVKNGH